MTYPELLNPEKQPHPPKKEDSKQRKEQINSQRRVFLPPWTDKCCKVKQNSVLPFIFLLHKEDFSGPGREFSLCVCVCVCSFWGDKYMVLRFEI